jgi:hypothetical protein
MSECVSVRVCVCVRARVCVKEREREIGGETETERQCNPKLCHVIVFVEFVGCYVAAEVC